MVTRKTLLAKGLAVALASYPQLIAAEGFTGADVLEWTDSQRASLIDTSLAMLSVVAARSEQTRPITGCLFEWYWSSEDQKAAAVLEITEAFQRFGEHDPQAIILVLVERQCGSFF